MTKLNPIKYFAEVREEMQKVTWPSQKETIRYSVIVSIISVAVGLFFALLDTGFKSGLEGLLQLF